MKPVLSTHQVAALAEIGRAITSSPPDLRELAEITYLEAARLIEADFFQLGIFEEDTYRTLIWVRDGEQLEELTLPLGAQAEGFFEWIRETRRPLLISNFEEEHPEFPAQFGQSRADPPASGIFAPLRQGDRAIGMIAIQNRRVEAFSPEQLSLLEVIASTLSPSLANAQLREREDNLSSQIELAREVSQQLASLDPLEERVERIVFLVCQAFGYREVALYEEANASLHLWKSSLDEPQSRPASSPIPEVVWTCRETRQASNTGSPQVGAGIPDGEPPSSDEIAFPMMVEERFMGVLYIATQPGQAISRERSSLLRMLSTQIAFAIQEARNYSQQQEETWITTVLLEVARHAAQPGNPEEALEAVLQLAILLGGVNWAMLLLNYETGGSLSVGPAAGLKRGELLNLANVHISPESLGISDELVENEEPSQVNLPDDIADVLGSRKALSIPLTDGRVLLGVLLFEDQPMPGRRSLILGGIAHQISLRIENTRLIEEAAHRRSLERELETARNIQASFLPDSYPHYPGWEVGVTWKAAREMGGDFYDFIALPEGDSGPRWGIVVADIADKGVPAALYMALCRTLLRTLALNHPCPDETLAEVNKLLVEDARTDIFVSVFYGVWEPASGKMVYANAGHNPPMVITPGVRAAKLTTHGMVLGVEPQASYEAAEIQIHEGEYLVLYTDGVTEAFDSNGEMFGSHRLEHLILGSQDLAAQSIAERVNERVLRFSGGRELSDDLTAVVLRRTVSTQQVLERG
jgi:serine phosphatase RsbU (regulator of sigma subunit)/transcriptional regulator with GAF, ATPase, and Fis domain